MVAKFNLIHQSMRNYFKICRQTPHDAIAFAFLVVTAILTYIYGTFHILPVLLAEYGFSYHVIGTSITTWIFVCILSNLFLIRIRDSSIRNRMLLQPLIKPPPAVYWDTSGADGETSNISEEQLIRERAKYMGQQFMARPYGEDEPWHICAACEVFVPPRAWHCHFCRTCILRRDHHCIFSMCCIGEENHCNFLGMVFYLGCGTSVATWLNITYTVYFTDTVWWMFILKAFVPFYTIFFDFDVMNLLSGINLMGQCVAWMILLYYLMLAAKSQTSADGSRGISRSIPGQKLYSITNLKNMLGPKPFLRIIWPFHPVLKMSYGSPVIPEDQNRKGL